MSESYYHTLRSILLSVLPECPTTTEVIRSKNHIHGIIHFEFPYETHLDYPLKKNMFFWYELLQILMCSIQLAFIQAFLFVENIKYDLSYLSFDYILSHGLDLYATTNIYICVMLFCISLQISLLVIRIFVLLYYGRTSKEFNDLYKPIILLEYRRLSLFYVYSVIRAIQVSCYFFNMTIFLTFLIFIFFVSQPIQNTSSCIIFWMYMTPCFIFQCIRLYMLIRITFQDIVSEIFFPFIPLKITPYHPPEDIELKCRSKIESKTLPIDWICSICSTDIMPADEIYYIETICEHVYHFSCLTNWNEIQQNCPLCRKKWNPTESHTLFTYEIPIEMI